MEGWVKISLILCIYGVLKEFRPAEPFVTKYLNQPPMNFTLDQINVDIYPISIYSSMALVVVMFLITDMVRYKPIIIINSLAGIGVYTMLITCRSLIAVQILEVLYGFLMACDVAYYTYIFAKVDKGYYQQVSGHTRAAYLVGRCISGILSQILVLLGYSYLILNYVTLGGMIVSLVWACLLPPVAKSLYFHSSEDSELADESKMVNFVKFLLRGFERLWKDFVGAFTNIYVVKWSLWWALATCSYYQVLTYIQPLWEVVIKENKITGYTSQLNGGVEALYTVTSALVAFYCGKLNMDWSKYGEAVLTVCSFILAGTLYALSQLNNIWVSHGVYILYALIFNGMITIATSEVAKYVRLDSHGLVFGINLFVAMIMQSLLTYIVVDKMQSDARTQFIIYGLYYCVVGGVFGVKSICSYITLRCSKDSPVD